MHKQETINSENGGCLGDSKAPLKQWRGALMYVVGVQLNQIKTRRNQALF